MGSRGVRPQASRDQSPENYTLTYRTGGLRYPTHLHAELPVAGRRWARRMPWEGNRMAPRNAVRL